MKTVYVALFQIGDKVRVMDSDGKWHDDMILSAEPDEPLCTIQGFVDPQPDEIELVARAVYMDSQQIEALEIVWRTAMEVDGEAEVEHYNAVAAMIGEVKGES